MERFTYLLYRAVVAVIGWLPLDMVFVIGQAAGFAAWVLAVPYRRLALQNVRIAFAGEKSEREMREIVRVHFVRLGANVLSGIRLSTMPESEILKRVEMPDQRLMEAFAAGKGVVVAVSHIGNWEMRSQITSDTSGVSLAAIYQPLGNRFIDLHVKQTRGAKGIRLFNRSQGFTRAIQVLREGGGVGLLTDQHAGDGGVWAPLFGRLASSSPLPATLVLRTGAALLPMAAFTIGRARWRMASRPAIDCAGMDRDAITAEMNTVLESQIRESPADWFWVHDRWKTPSPAFLLNRYKRGVAFPRGFDAKSLKSFNILIRSSNWLGDAVMTVPAVRAIKAGRPDARVTVLVKSKLADFWRRVDAVDDVIEIGAGESTLRVAAKLRGRFDVAVVLPNSLRSAAEVWLAGIPRRIGYRGHARAVLLNQIFEPAPPEKPGPKPHQVFHYLDLARWIGAAEQPATFESRVAPASSPARVGLCPGAEYGPAKRWPSDRFLEVAKAVSERRECRWVLFGAAGDTAAGAPIADGLGEGCENRIGKTSLAELMDELAQCRLLLTNDTGTMHLAAFLGVPVVAIFGSTEPALTGPLGDGHRVIRRHVECSPCFLRTCPIDLRCMNEIETGRVVEAVLRKLDA